MNNAHPERNYPDLHDHIRALEHAGHLRRVDIPINKDTELTPPGPLAVSRRRP